MHPLTIADVQKKIIGNSRPIFIYFYSQRSEPSTRHMAEIERWELEFPNVLFFKADVTDDKNQLRKDYSVTDVPATLLIVSGNSTGLNMNANGFSEQELQDIRQMIIDYAP